MLLLRFSSSVRFATYLLPLLFIITGCADEETRDNTNIDTTAGQAAEETSAGDDGVATELPLSVEDMVDQASNPTPGQEYPPFLAQLPRADEVETEAVENRHVQGQVDTMRTHRYGAVSIRVYDVSDSPSRIVTRIEVEEDDRETGLPIDVGTDESRVVEELGEPVERQEDRLRYQWPLDGDEPAAAPNYLDIYLTAGTVKRIAWEFYYD